MDKKIKSCDICGENQKTANNWYSFRIVPDLGFTAFDSNLKKRKGKLDACGQACLTKAFNSWLVAVHVNALVEVKKDEIPNQ